MLNLFSKIIFWIEKPQIVIVLGRGRSAAAGAISQVLGRSHAKAKVCAVGPENSSEAANAKFFAKHSSFPITVITHSAAQKDGEVAETASLIYFIENLPPRGKLIINYDDETLRQAAKKAKVQCLSFGFQEGADLRATDVFITESPSPGTNFKVNYDGKIVPFWLTNLFGEDHIYAALAAAAVGSAKGLNLVTISQALMGGNQTK